MIMNKLHYTIPEGCTGVTVQQEGSRLIIEFITEPKRWRAEKGGNYYNIGEGVIWNVIEDNDPTDDDNFYWGNYFQSRDEAVTELERIKRWKAK
jgi:hypothetical protein